MRQLSFNHFLRPRVLIAIGAALGLLATAAVAGAVLRGAPESRHASSASKPARTVVPPTAAATTVPTTTAPTTTTTTGPTQPAHAKLPPLPEGGLRSGSSGFVVAAYQKRLADLHFDPGAVDGHYGLDTSYAVTTLQKMSGFRRTGRLGNAEAMVLSGFKYPTPLAPKGEPNRTEIDIGKQVLTLYQNNQVRLVTTVSSGSGEYYCYTDKYRPVRVCENAYTPSGRYTYTRFANGWDRSPLGRLYNPFYFNGGIAVHGYTSVPNSPASHGCVRIPMTVSRYFHTLVAKGDPVYVFGGSNGRSRVRTTPLPPTTAAPVLPPGPAPAAPLAPAPAPATPPTTKKPGP
jgi:peptidoglycan hydrolase-like protein with peptidoglycan-binding domain